MAKTKWLFNHLTYKTRYLWCSLDTGFRNVAGSVSLSLLLWNVANTSCAIVCIQLPPRLPMMQDQKLLMHHWLSCSGWGREHVSLIFGYTGSQYIRKGKGLTKLNILQVAVRYQNGTMNRKTRNTQPEIATDGLSPSRQNALVDGYESGLKPPRRSWLTFWTVQGMNRTSFAVWTRTAGGLPGPVAITNSGERIEILMQQPAFREHMSYAPAKEFNDAEERIYSEVKWSNWWWNEQVH